MAYDDINLAEKSGSLVESQKNYDPRVVLFYFALAAALVFLAGGLAYQQLFLNLSHKDNERMQTQRRVLIPGPRGNILDRNQNILVGNLLRFSVVLYLDELRGEFYREYVRIHNNYIRAGIKKDGPSVADLASLARVSVAQRYLDQINVILHRSEKVETKTLLDHFKTELLLPYTLLDDLSPEDYARLLEHLPVNSPVQVYSKSTRSYPYGSLAAHTLGYVGADDDVSGENFPGKGLRTINMPGTSGVSGLEKQFDDLLQGEAGGSIFRVDPAGYRVDPPLAEQAPKQGKDLVTSLDLDLQLTAESALGDQTGAAVAIDIATGEVLVLASKPDYDLSKFREPGTIADIQAQHAWTNLALNGFWPPGSTFKILTSIAALRQGTITPDVPIVDCEGTTRIGNATFVCENGLVHHGEILLRDAIAQSCDIYFYQAGLLTSPEVVAAEGRRFHLDQPTGIDLPNEGHRMVMPEPGWKAKTVHEPWYPGDTAHMAIGQGFVLVTPLQMACFAASVARNEVYTKPTLLHDPNRPRQHSESIGLTAAQRAALLEGMEGCTLPPHGTARNITENPAFRVPGIRIAGKTGTAQKDVVKDGKRGTINYAWFICFAPIEHPEIAMAVAIEGDTIGESFGGGFHAAPIASAVLKKYFEKKQRGGALFTPPASN